VEAAVAELGYVPNRLARSLRSKRTHTLALVLTDIPIPFLPRWRAAWKIRPSDAGYTVIFCNTDESETEEQKYCKVVLQPASRWSSAGAGAQHGRIGRNDSEEGYPRRGARSPNASQRMRRRGALRKCLRERISW